MVTDKIRYNLTFLSDWHAGSGLSSGSQADNIVIKDKSNLPYLPGKTIKGLLKSALLDLNELQPEVFRIDQIYACFGCSAEEKDRLNEKQKLNESLPGRLFFSNAQISQEIQRELSPEMTEYLYREIASTGLTEKGVAKENSLRVIEVCIPLTLEGEIVGLREGDRDLIQKSMAYTRQLGANRNRGLGRCKFNIV